MSATAAFGQIAAYEVIDLGRLPVSSPVTPESVAYGINNKHEVVGASRHASDETHAVLWLYCANYGLDAFTLHDLTVMASLSDRGQAYDINDAGLVVGEQTASADAARPYLWDLPTWPTTFQTLELAIFSSNPTFGGAARAVSNSNPAVIVGTCSTDFTCFTTGNYLSRGFRYIQGDPPAAISELEPDEAWTASATNDVNPAASTAAGVSTNACFLTSCGLSFVGSNWGMSSLGVNTLPSGLSWGSYAYGVNDAGDTVGLADAGPGQSSPGIGWCHRTGWLWSTSSMPVNLGAIGVPSGHESLAYKLTNPGPTGELYVVGQNLTSDHAWRWYRDGGGSWSGVNLNSRISPLCGWELRVANDVSEDGWIVGYGVVTGSGAHAFLLKPVECLEDLNGSCSVNGADLGVLLSAFACEAPCALCAADLNLDGQIDGADLGILLGNWSNICECFSCPSSFMSESFGEGGVFESALAQVLLALGFESVPNFTAWANEEGNQEQAAAVLDWILTYLDAQF